MWLELIIKILLDTGTTILLMWFVFYFGYRFLDRQDIFSKVIRKWRKINNEIEEQEIRESKEKIKQVQHYIHNHKNEVFAKGQDRITVLLAHNGIQWVNDFHFLFYSIIWEACVPQLKPVSNMANLQRVSYHTMVEYEELTKKAEDWRYFTNDLDKLWSTAKSIADMLWTKSLCVNAIYDTEWHIKGLVICSAVFKPLKEQPDNKQFIDNIRALLI